MALLAVVIGASACGSGAPDTDTRDGSVEPSAADPSNSDRVAPIWADVTNGLREAHDPLSDNPCTAGRPPCADLVLAELGRRLEQLAEVCDHDAVFGDMYVAMTAATVADLDSSLPEDAAVVSLVATFASAYLDAFDAWHGGRRDDVGEAWQVAFEFAEQERGPALADAFLALNAHITLDLPIALATVWPDRLSQSPSRGFLDANHRIESLTPTVLAELAERYDGTLTLVDVPFTDFDAAGFGAAISEWRAEAWDNAVELATATGSNRAASRMAIERTAVSRAAAIALALAYPPLLDGAGARRADCLAAQTTGRG